MTPSWAREFLPCNNGDKVWNYYFGKGEIDVTDLNITKRPSQCNRAKLQPNGKYCTLCFKKLLIRHIDWFHVIYVKYLGYISQRPFLLSNINKRNILMIKMQTSVKNLYYKHAAKFNSDILSRTVPTVYKMLDIVNI